MAARKTTAARKANDQIFAVEIEPGVHVYSLPPRDTMPAATRKMIDEMNARAAEDIRQGWEEVQERIAARRTGDTP